MFEYDRLQRLQRFDHTLHQVVGLRHRGAQRFQCVFRPHQQGRRRTSAGALQGGQHLDDLGAARIERAPDLPLAGVERPAFEDTETTFDELQARIAKTIAFLETIDPGKLDGAESRTVTLTVRGNDVHFRGDAYLLYFALPNFFFHVATAHDILRHAGVEIGKLDYLGPFRTE